MFGIKDTTSNYETAAFDLFFLDYSALPVFSSNAIHNNFVKILVYFYNIGWPTKIWKVTDISEIVVLCILYNIVFFVLNLTLQAKIVYHLLSPFFIIYFFRKFTSN